MPDEMFFSKDDRSLVRGKRIAKRTDTCRPCQVTLSTPEQTVIDAVVLDITPHGMLVRTMETLPLEIDVSVQLMRDDTFQHALSAARPGRVVRLDDSGSGFYDYGIKLVNLHIPRNETRPIRIDPPKPDVPRKPSRMQTLDITIGGAHQGRNR
ncbi:MAG: hypothetical protein COA73_09025 [Candidatus Hydrogenedentota bacterium]|nr:MAG: hypothetical protein COA73_09025 [Candidatus Hydrogenedentota bacterium]